LVYVATFAEAVYVLHAFQKKDAADAGARYRPRSLAIPGTQAEYTAMRRQRFRSVWDAIESSPAQAANMKARSEMMLAIRDTVASWRTTQAVAAKRLGLTQPRMNDLVRGRINKFSLDALINLAARAGLSVRVEVVRPAA
jgi:predicted XRE-type DNA-binding protein